MTAPIASSDPSEPTRLHDDAHAAFLMQWARAAGTVRYDRDEWLLIQRQLHAHCSPGCLTPEDDLP